MVLVNDVLQSWFQLTLFPFAVRNQCHSAYNHGFPRVCRPSLSRCALTSAPDSDAVCRKENFPGICRRPLSVHAFDRNSDSLQLLYRRHYASFIIWTMNESRGCTRSVLFENKKADGSHDVFTTGQNLFIHVEATAMIKKICGMRLHGALLMSGDSWSHCFHCYVYPFLGTNAIRCITYIVWNPSDCVITIFVLEDHQVMPRIVLWVSHYDD